MSKDTLQRAFEPFFTTKKPGEGTGLGLSQVYAFARQSKGHIEIESELGRGTTIRLYLPAAPEEARQEQVPDLRVSAYEPPTILVVEDDHDVRGYVAGILRELHYRVLEAHDAETAIGLIARGDIPVDLLVADVVLPGMNGVQLAKEIKARQPEASVLFMTGYDAISDAWPVDSDIPILHKPLTRAAIEDNVHVLMREVTRTKLRVVRDVS
jgi:CheY-like chemotaxis protein